MPERITDAYPLQDTGICNQEQNDGPTRQGAKIMKECDRDPKS